MQEVKNSAYYLLKEVNLLHGNDGICSKMNRNFHPFFGFPFSMILIAWTGVIERKNWIIYYAKLLKGKKWNCTQKDRITEPLFRVLNHWGLVRGFSMSLYRSIANTPVRSVWLGSNVTLELYFFLRKFVANCLNWNKCMFFLVWMMRVSLKHFIDKFVNERKHNWLNKVDMTFKGGFGSQMFLPVCNNYNLCDTKT